MALTAVQLDQYHSEGHLVIRNLLTEEELDVLRRHADQIAAGELAHIPERCIQEEPGIKRGEIELPDDRALAIRKIYELVPYDDIMRAHARSKKIVDIVADILDTPDLKIYGDQLFMKPPRHGSRKGYHQDSHSWIYIKPYDLVSCWVAMDDATTENGCLWVLPGSHKWGLVGSERAAEIETLTKEGRLGEQDLEEIPVELKAGDCSFHHSLLLHSSYSNKSDRRRRGYATHYMRSTSKFIPDLARGKEKPDYPLARGKAFEGCV